MKITHKVKFSRKATERLLKLAKLLRADARRKRGIKFDMGSFCVVDFDKLETEGVIPFTPEMNCGTSACALGLAAISGEFRGLTLKVKNLGYRDTGVDFYLNGEIIDPFDAASEVFDIPEAVANWLFGGDASNKLTGADAELEMAEIIEKAVKKGGVPDESH